MRILYFLSAVMLAVVLIVGCTGDPKGVVDPVQKTGMVPPPPAEGPCDPNPCENGGQCTDNGDGSFTCTCPPGWAGTNCESNIDEYEANPCANGLCQDGHNQAICECLPGWTGANCTNGQCLPDGNGGFVCTCEGFPDTGTMCNEPVVTDPCEANPCQNGGQCADNGSGGYTCTCAPGYTGDNCETDFDECGANPCVYGDCTDLVNAYQCDCYPGWTGTICDVPVVTDADGDGVPDGSDNCANTASGAVVDATGCSIAQYCPCDNNWKNHGAYVSCVAHSANNFVAAGLITQAQKSAIVSAAGQSNCGKKK